MPVERRRGFPRSLCGNLWSAGGGLGGRPQVFHRLRQARQIHSLAPRLGAAIPPAQRDFAIAARSRAQLRRAAGIAHRLALQVEAVGVVDQAIEHGVGQGRLTKGLVPIVDR